MDNFNNEDSDDRSFFSQPSSVDSLRNNRASRVFEIRTRLSHDAQGGPLNETSGASDLIYAGSSRATLRVSGHEHLVSLSSRTSYNVPTTGKPGRDVNAQSKIAVEVSDNWSSKLTRRKVEATGPRQKEIEEKPTRAKVRFEDDMPKPKPETRRPILVERDHAERNVEYKWDDDEKRWRIFLVKPNRTGTPTARAGEHQTRTRAGDDTSRSKPAEDEDETKESKEASKHPSSSKKPITVDSDDYWTNRKVIVKRSTPKPDHKEADEEDTESAISLATTKPNVSAGSKVSESVSVKSTVNGKLKTSEPASAKPPSNADLPWRKGDDIWKESRVSSSNHQEAERCHSPETTSHKTVRFAPRDQAQRDASGVQSKTHEPPQQKSKATSPGARRPNESKPELPGFLAFAAGRRGILKKPSSKPTPEAQRSESSPSAKQNSKPLSSTRNVSTQVSTSTAGSGRRIKDDDPLPTSQPDSRGCTCHHPNESTAHRPPRHPRGRHPVDGGGYYVYAPTFTGAALADVAPASRPKYTSDKSSDSKQSSEASPSSTEILENVYNINWDKGSRASRHKTRDKEGYKEPDTRKHVESRHEGSKSHRRSHSKPTSRLDYANTASSHSRAPETLQSYYRGLREAGRVRTSSYPASLMSQDSRDSSITPWDSISQTSFQEDRFAPLQEHYSVIRSSSKASRASDKTASMVRTIDSNYHFPYAESYHSSDSSSKSGKKRLKRSGQARCQGQDG